MKMDIKGLKAVFAEQIEPYGEATQVIYASGGLMAHHDGVNSAVTSFWEATEAYVESGGSVDGQEFDKMYGRVMNLAINAHTKVEKIVGSQRYFAVMGY